MEGKEGISRRGFLAGGTLLGAAAAVSLTACAPSTEAAEVASNDVVAAPATDWLGSEPVIADADIIDTFDTEVVVIGAGTGGLFAACALGELGVETLVLEKINGGVVRDDLGGVNSRLQQENGYTIDKQAFLVDMNRYAAGQVNIKLYDKWFDNSAETIDWYEQVLADYGVTLWHEHDAKEHQTVLPHWATGHSPEWPMDGSQSGFTVLTDYAEKTGKVTFMYNTPMIKLVIEDDKVVGVIAESEEGYIRVNASKGTVISTGGYGMNREMLKALQPRTLSMYGMIAAQPGNDGDGIKALVWAGAKMDNLHTAMIFDRSGMPPDAMGDDDSLDGDLFWMGSQPWMKVNLDGKRFCNESGPYDFVTHAVTAQPGGMYVTLWDSDYPKYAEQFDMHGCSRMFPFDNGAPPNIPMEVVMGMNMGLLEKGYIQQADTIEELAEKLGLPVDNLVESVNRNNENYDNQVDPDFFKEPWRLSPLRQAPFYGIRNTGMILCTIDGVVVNEESQPLRPDGTAIDGVFVLGNDSGSYYALTYPNLSTGNACGRTVTFARLLAKQLASA